MVGASADTPDLFFFSSHHLKKKRTENVAFVDSNWSTLEIQSIRRPAGGSIHLGMEK